MASGEPRRTPGIRPASAHPSSSSGRKLAEQLSRCAVNRTPTDPAILAIWCPNGARASGIRAYQLCRCRDPRHFGSVDRHRPDSCSDAAASELDHRQSTTARDRHEAAAAHVCRRRSPRRPMTGYHRNAAYQAPGQQHRLQWFDDLAPAASRRRGTRTTTTCFAGQPKSTVTGTPRRDAAVPCAT